MTPSVEAHVALCGESGEKRDTTKIRLLQYCCPTLPFSWRHVFDWLDRIVGSDPSLEL